MNYKVHDTDCTAQCHSARHGAAIISALTRREPTDEEMAAYVSSVCSNLGSVTDDVGRLALHMAVSCGRRDVAQWLIRRHGASVNAKDIESGYTPLHRSLFYGQLHVAVSLLQLGAKMTTPDYDDLTPLDHVMKDRFPTVEFSTKRPCEVYVWGSNFNYNLGTGNQQARPQPELLDCFRKINVAIQQVCMDKFHSVFVSACGRVWSCGHGQGGRLGLGTESTVLTPQEVPLGVVLPSPAASGSAVPEVCVMVAVGRDHTLLLMESGSVLSCGLNTHHVLGHTPPPNRLLKPRPILPKHLRVSGDEIKGVCASRFHSVVWTSKEVLTFGLHAGQLGHAEGPEKTILLPKPVTNLNHKDAEITHVAASDGATVVVFKNRNIFVLHEYQKIRLGAKHAFDVAQVTVIGGNLDSRVDTSSLLDKGEALKVVALSTVGTVYLWQEKELHFTRCILAVNRQLTITYLAMSRHSLLFVTNDGEAFMGEVKPRKKTDDRRRIAQQLKKESDNKDYQQMGPNLTEFLDPNDCETVGLERLPHIHRAVRIACDPKGRNFAVIQTHPAAALVDVPQIPPSEMQKHLRNLLFEATEDDALHDLIFQTGLRRFPAHQFITASSSEVLVKLIKQYKEECKEDGIPVIHLKDVHPDIFQHLLQYMYTGECQLAQPGPCNIMIADVDIENKNVLFDNSPDGFFPLDGNSVSAYEVHKKQHENSGKKNNRGNKKDTEKVEDSQPNPVTLAKEAAKQLGLTKLARQFDAVRYEDGYILWSENTKRRATVQPLTLQYKQRPELHDVSIRTTDGKIYNAHKCILAARSEYFHHMLAGGWIETRSSKELNLPLHSSVLELLFDYFYKDSTPVLDGANSEDLELAWRALVSADQLLVTGFRARCEAALASMLTLRNVATMLEMSCTYNANQLRNCCYQYICLNLPAVLEARTLESVTPQNLDLLRDCYHKQHPRMGNRVITPFSNTPSSDEIQAVSRAHPVPWNPEEDMDFDCLEDLNDQRKQKVGSKKKSRVRRVSDVGRRNRNESISSINSDDLETPMDVEPMDWNELVEKQKEPDITLSFSQVAITEETSDKKKDNGLEPWVKILSGSKQQRAVQTRLKAAAIARAETPEVAFVRLTPLKHPSDSIPQAFPSPPHTPNGGEVSSQAQAAGVRGSLSVSPPKPIAPEILQKHFPQLGHSESTRTPAKTCPTPTSGGNTGTPPSSEKRPMKLSQKQRKKLAAEDTSGMTPLPSPSTSRGWGTINDSRGSFADIIQQEKGKMKRPGLAPSYPIPIRSSPSTSASSPWSRIASPHSPATPPATPPASSAPSTSAISRELNFSDIVADEMKQRENWTRMRAKPLNLTQIEDKAIDDLINFYNAEDSSEERITVRRVVNTQVAKPLWVTSRH